MPTLRDLRDTCGSISDDEQNTEICGAVSIDVDSTDPDNNKPSTSTPKYTTCLYVLYTGDNEFITDQLVIKTSFDEEVYVIATLLDGTEVEIFSISDTRNLQDSDTNEGTREQVFDIVEAEKVTVTYRATKFEKASTFNMQLASMSTPEESSSNSESSISNSALLIIIAILCALIIVVLMIVTAIVIYKRQNSAKDPKVS